MIQLTRGRTELNCRDNVGGVKTVYLFTYKPYSITQIVRNGQNVTSFPTTDIYEFYCENPVFSEQINDENGNISYNQTLNFRLNKQDKFTTFLLDSVKDLFFSYILQFNDGSLRLGGLYQGANLRFDVNSGGTKADGTSYNVTFEGVEEISAPYLDNLNDFTTAQYLLLEDGSFFLLEDGGKLILE